MFNLINCVIHSVLINIRSTMPSWRRCRWPSGSWRRISPLPDVAATSMKLNLETRDKQVRSSKEKPWNTNKGSRRYVNVYMFSPYMFIVHVMSKSKLNQITGTLFLCFVFLICSKKQSTNLLRGIGMKLQVAQLMNYEHDCVSLQRRWFLFWLLIIKYSWIQVNCIS